MYFVDGDDVDFTILLTNWASPFAIAASCVCILICMGVALAHWNKCAALCAPQEGRVLENACYCVTADGALVTISGSE